MRYIDVTTHFGNFIKQQNIIEANYDGETEKCVIIDDVFFNQLYNLKNSGSKATILQLCLFPDDQLILDKCRSKVGFYMVAKISINLANKCIISPEHNITDLRVDNMFIIKSFDSYIPNVCLEIDEDGHNDREKNNEIARENFIKSFGYKIIRVPVKRHESKEEVDKLIIKTTKDIELMIEDLITEYSLQNISETDFINKVNNDMTIDREFARMFVRKNDDNFEHFKYKHSEIATFLGYETTDNCKHFLTMMKKELRQEKDYIITIYNQDAQGSAGTRRPLKVLLEDVKKSGQKPIYYVSRIGFYILCMMANKPNAKIYRRQFGELYEFSINYVNSLKKKVITNIQPSNISENAVKDRLDYKVENTIKNKSVAKYEVENIKLKNENEQLKKQIELITLEKEKFKLDAEFYMNKNIEFNKQLIILKKPKENNKLKINVRSINNFMNNYLPKLEKKLL